MSLDVYLSLPGTTTPARVATLVREDGATREVTAAEWARRAPDGAPVTCLTAATEDVYHANITHNLHPMAEAVGLYGWLWRPEEHGVTTAQQLLAPLREGLARLMEGREALLAFAPRPGWGSYEGLVAFVEHYLAACTQWPEALVRVSR